MIVLLSSAHRVRYADDIVRLLALPQAGQIQLRYETPLLSADLLNRVPREQLADKPALVCFVAATREIIPVRFVRIIRAERLGTTVIFTVAASAFVTNLGDAAVRAAIASEDRDRLPTPGIQGRKDELFAVDGLGVWAGKRATSLDAFEATTKRLSSDPAFSGSRTAFFHVVRLSVATERSWFGTWPRPMPIREGTYALAAGKRYQCEIYCLHYFEAGPNPVGPPAPQLALAAEANDAWLQFGSVKRHAVDTRYDVKRFIFEAENNALRRVSGISLFLTEGLDGKRADYRQDIILPIVFRGSWMGYLVRALAVGVGTAVPSLIAINAAGKLDVGIGLIVAALGIVAGAAAVIPGFKAKA